MHHTHHPDHAAHHCEKVRLKNLQTLITKAKQLLAPQAHAHAQHSTVVELLDDACDEINVILDLIIKEDVTWDESCEHFVKILHAIKHPHHTGHNPGYGR